MYCPKCRVTMKGDAQGFYKCVICGHVAHDLVNRVTKSDSDDDAPDPGPSFAQKMQGEIMQMAAAPLLNALGALAQIPAALTRIATALEDRAKPSPLDAVRGAHGDLSWLPVARGAMGTVYEARTSRDRMIIVRPDGKVWTATMWCGVETESSVTAPTPDAAVGVLRGNADIVSFRYCNHADETRTVRVLNGTQSVTMERTIYHPYDGPKVRAWDVDRSDWRVYDPARIVKP